MRAASPLPPGELMNARISVPDGGTKPGQSQEHVPQGVRELHGSCIVSTMSTRFHIVTA